MIQLKNEHAPASKEMRGHFLMLTKEEQTNIETKKEKIQDAVQGFHDEHWRARSGAGEIEQSASAASCQKILAIDRGCGA